MRNLGILYETGSGVRLDKKKAERLYRMAADRATRSTKQGTETREVDLSKADAGSSAAAKGHERQLQGTSRTSTRERA
ncbi:hypothetical protein SO694_00140030 [Aureococcus anophagefferens]|uniref:Uncharacterized protein n=1 Tax=Aureococcus anophagefferens TaxID=44056 RepID=A0ABR1FPH1_AURAN